MVRQLSAAGKGGVPHIDEAIELVHRAKDEALRRIVKEPPTAPESAPEVLVTDDEDTAADVVVFMLVVQPGKKTQANLEACFLPIKTSDEHNPDDPVEELKIIEEWGPWTPRCLPKQKKALAPESGRTVATVPAMFKLFGGVHADQRTPMVPLKRVRHRGSCTRIATTPSSTLLPLNCSAGF